MRIYCPFCDGNKPDCESCHGAGTLAIFGISVNGRPIDPEDYPDLINPDIVAHPKKRGTAA